MRLLEFGICDFCGLFRYIILLSGRTWLKVEDSGRISLPLKRGGKFDPTLESWRVVRFRILPNSTTTSVNFGLNKTSRVDFFNSTRHCSVINERSLIDQTQGSLRLYQVKGWAYAYMYGSWPKLHLLHPIDLLFESNDQCHHWGIIFSQPTWNSTLTAGLRFTHRPPKIPESLLNILAPHLYPIPCVGSIRLTIPN